MRPLIALAVAFLVVMPVPALAQDAPEQQDEWAPQLREIARRLVRLRQKRYKKPVPMADQSVEDFEVFVREELEDALPTDRIDGMMKGLVRLGVVDKPFDLGEGMVDALLSQAAGYYDPEAEKFYVLFTGMPAMFRDTLYAHEMVHALQDQHFALDKLMAAREPKDGGVRNDDAMLALQFLVEGEATYVQTLFQLDLSGQAGNQMALGISMMMMANMTVESSAEQSKLMLPMMGEGEGVERMKKAIEDMGRIPRYIMVPLFKAYTKGAAYVYQKHRKGGWAAVNRLYENLPESTEQCLRPDRADDLPTRLELPALEWLQEDGWQEADAAVHGEVYLRLMLENMGVDTAFEQEQTTGDWDGDIYRAWTRDDEVLIVFASTWDTEAAAERFHGALTDGIASWGYVIAPGPAGPKVLYDCGAAKDGEEDPIRSGGVGRLVHRGREVFRVEGADAATCDRIVQALESMPVERR